MFLKLLIHSLLINIPIAKTSLIWNGGSKENITVNVDKFCYVKLTTPARNEIKFKENRDERDREREHARNILAWRRKDPRQGMLCLRISFWQTGLLCWFCSLVAQ